MSDYNTDKKKRKLTREQRDLLIAYHKAVINIPSTEELIKVFKLPITKQAISQASQKEEK